MSFACSKRRVSRYGLLLHERTITKRNSGSGAIAHHHIEGQVYSHPIGDHGHAPGSTIGFTNLPEFVPVLGELPILPNSYYSIELFARVFVPERDEYLRFMLEENAYWNPDIDSWEFVIGRQKEYHVVNSTAGQRQGFVVQSNGNSS